MKFTKKIILSSVLALGLLSQVAIGSAEESVGQLTVKLTGSDLNGALTLDSVADLSGQININGNNNTIAPLTKTGDIEITDTRDEAKPWHLSVEVKQPKERGTNVPLGANAISFNIDTHGGDNLEAFNPINVLRVSAKVLGGKFDQTIPATYITSELTLDNPFHSKAKGVYENTIIYTLVDDVDSSYTVTFDSDGGSEVLSQTIEKYSNAKAVEPANPTKGGFDFLGWYEGGSETRFDFSKKITKNTTLKAKWKSYAPKTDGTPVAGETIQFADTDWRILRVNGNKALVIKYNALTTNEATGAIGTEVHYTKLRDTLRYFSSNGTNGYEAGGGGTTYLKGKIDYYYNNKISKQAKEFILPVDLDNPDLTTFNATLGTSWSWNTQTPPWNYNSHTFFATSLSDISNNNNDFKKQAFALSVGDIQNSTGMNMGGVGTVTLLQFPNANVNNFYLRTAGAGTDYGSVILNGQITGNHRVDSNEPIRPALWISLS